MRVLIFGASGMIGTGVLIECLADVRVESILAVGRTPPARSHPKLRELHHGDFTRYDDVLDQLAPHDACFFCLGVSSAGISEAEYEHLTFDVTIAAAEAIGSTAPGMVFCYVSGEGTDSTERGRVRWARVKGRTENRLLAMPLDAYMFRPGYVQPLKGVRSKTRLYQALYNVATPLFPVMERLIPTHVTTSERLGRAMIEVAASGYSRRILENDDINHLGMGSSRS